MMKLQRHCLSLPIFLYKIESSRYRYTNQSTSVYIYIYIYILTISGVAHSPGDR